MSDAEDQVNDHSEEEEASEDEEVEQEHVPNGKKKPAPRKAKKEASSDEELEEDDKDDDFVPSGKKKPAAKKPKPNPKKRKDDDDLDEDWGKRKKKKSAGGGRGKNSGFTKPFKLSAELADLVGADVMPRHEVVKKIWAFIKEKELQDPKNKQFAICDDQLFKVIGEKRFRTFGMMKYLKGHFLEAA